MMDMETRVADAFNRAHQQWLPGADPDRVLRDCARMVAAALHPDSGARQLAFLDACNVSGLFAGCPEDLSRESAE